METDVQNQNSEPIEEGITQTGTRQGVDCPQDGKRPTNNQCNAEQKQSDQSTNTKHIFYFIHVSPYIRMGLNRRRDHPQQVVEQPFEYS
jgi:hypothetical protein